jgi:hypothetical protein
MRHLTLGLALAPTVAMAAPRKSPPPTEVVVVDPSEPTVRRAGEFSAEWVTTDPGGARCEVFVLVDTAGRPVDAVPMACPDAFLRSAVTGLMATRWEPLLRGGAPTAFSFSTVVQFRPVQPPASTSVASARP